MGRSYHCCAAMCGYTRMSMYVDAIEIIKKIRNIIEIGIHVYIYRNENENKNENKNK